MFVHLRKYRLEPKDKKYFVSDKVSRLIIEPSLDDPDLLFALVELENGKQIEVFDVIDAEVM